MPPAHPNLDVNVLVSISKRFIKNVDAKNILRAKYDWNTPRLCFKGRTTGRSEVNNHVMYEVILDEVPGVRMTVKQGSIKYLGPLETGVPDTTDPTDVITALEETEDLLEDAIEEEDEQLEVDLTPTDGWTNGEVFVDSRLCGESYQQSKAKLNLVNSKNATPLDYFLFFLPLDHFHKIINNTNLSARSIDVSWKDITYH